MKVEPISVLTIGDKTHAVSNCSDTVKKLVDVMNGWRQKEVDTRNDLMLVQAAVRDLQREIVATIQEEERVANAEKDQPVPEPVVEDDREEPAGDE